MSTDQVQLGWACGPRVQWRADALLAYNLASPGTAAVSCASGGLYSGPHKTAHPVGVDAGCGPRVVHMEAPYQRLERFSNAASVLPSTAPAFPATWLRSCRAVAPRPGQGFPSAHGRGASRGALRPSTLVPRTTEGRPWTPDQPSDLRRDGRIEPAAPLTLRTGSRRLRSSEAFSLPGTTGGSLRVVESLVSRVGPQAVSKGARGTEELITFAPGRTQRVRLRRA
jgi:hypothetical protein